MKKVVLLGFAFSALLMAGKSGISVNDGYYAEAWKHGIAKTYYINYKRYFYVVDDRYFNYDMNDLAVDYKKQMEREKKLKDTL